MKNVRTLSIVKFEFQGDNDPFIHFYVSNELIMDPPPFSWRRHLCIGYILGIFAFLSLLSRWLGVKGGQKLRSYTHSGDEIHYVKPTWGLNICS